MQVWLTDGRLLRGTVLERDTTADLALVQLEDTEPLTALAVGDPEGVRVGDEVLALAKIPQLTDLGRLLACFEDAPGTEQGQIGAG